MPVDGSDSLRGTVDPRSAKTIALVFFGAAWAVGVPFALIAAVARSNLRGTWLFPVVTTVGFLPVLVALAVGVSRSQPRPHHLRAARVWLTCSAVLTGLFAVAGAWVGAVLFLVMLEFSIALVVGNALGLRRTTAQRDAHIPGTAP